MTVHPQQVGRWPALLLWARGRHAPIGANSTAFPAVNGTLAMPAMFTVATVIEMVVLHLLIPALWVSAVVATARPSTSTCAVLHR